MAGCICLMLFGLPEVRSQSPERQEAETGGKEEVKPLEIGDTIPEALWNMPLQVVNHPEGKETITLSEYKDKLIILDFWTTWCGSCITALKNIEPIVKEHQNKIIALPVTAQSHRTIYDFGKKNEIVGNTSLHLVVNDTLLSSIFPHRFFPHTVFLREGEIIHIGGSESFSEPDILSFVKGEQKKQKYFKDDFSYERPLLSNGEERVNGEKYYRALTRYRRDSTPIQGNLIDSVTGTKRAYFYNSPLFDLVKYGMSLQAFKQNKIKFQNTSMSLDSFAYHRSKGNKLNWLGKNSFCYEAQVPIGTPDSIIRKMLIKDIEDLLGLKLEIIECNIEVLKIIGTSQRVKREKEDGMISLSNLLDAYNRLPTLLPLIDPDGLAPLNYFEPVDYSKWTSEKLLDVMRRKGLQIIKSRSVEKVLLVEGRIL